VYKRLPYFDELIQLDDLIIMGHRKSLELNHSIKIFYRPHPFLTPKTNLFPSENVLVEVKLQLFVGNIDAELLKRVLPEVLETKDVQDSNLQIHIRPLKHSSRIVCAKELTK